MIQELSHMDRITQLQDEIQQVRLVLRLNFVRTLTMGVVLVVYGNAAPYDHV